MKKYTYTKVLAHKGKYTETARAIHLSAKGQKEVPTLVLRLKMHEVYELDTKETIAQMIDSYADAKQTAFNYVMAGA